MRSIKKLFAGAGSTALALAACLAVSDAAQAAPQGAVATVNIERQALAGALRQLASQTRTEIVFAPATVRGKQAPPLRGRYSIDAGLQLLLEGTGLRARRTGQGGYVVEAAADAGAVTNGASSSYQNASSTVDEAAADILVTASRRTESLIETPMSVAAIGQDELDQRGIRSLLDLSRAVPGLVVSEQGPGQNRVFMRGVANPNSLTSLVGIYYDEIPVTGSALGQLDIPLSDLARVEVLRGPQGTLYGQGSVGGTIRYISNRPDLSGVSGEASLLSYHTDHGDPSARFSGVLNLPVVEDVFALRVSGTLAAIGGWIDQPDAGRENINDQFVRNVRVRGRLRVSDRFELDGSVIVHRNSGSGITVGADADYQVRYPNGDPLARQEMRDEYDIYNLTANYDFGGVNLVSSTSHVRSRKDVAGLSIQIPGLETFTRDGQRNSVFTQEVRLSNDGEGPFSWVVGAFYTDEKLSRDLSIDLYSGGALLGVNEILSSQTSETISVFGDASYALTGRLRLGVGLRYFHDNRTEQSGGVQLEAPFESVNPRFYASYELADRVHLYGNVAKGFRSGGFLGDAAVSTFDPERVWSYELGIKGDRGPFRWELTGFYGDYAGYQAFALVSDIFGGLQNAGNAEVMGVDFLMAYRPSRRLTLQVSGNVTRTELVDVLAGTTSNIRGDRLDFIPDYTLSASADYRFDWSPTLPGFARVDVNQIGKSTFTDRSTGVVEVPTDELTFLNARVGIDTDRWSVEAFAENLLGENGVQDPLAALGFGARPRPRTMGLRLATSF